MWHKINLNRGNNAPHLFYAVLAILSLLKAIFHLLKLSNIPIGNWWYCEGIIRKPIKGGLRVMTLKYHQKTRREA